MIRCAIGLPVASPATAKRPEADPFHCQVHRRANRGGDRDADEHTQVQGADAHVGHCGESTENGYDTGGQAHGSHGVLVRNAGAALANRDRDCQRPENGSSHAKEPARGTPHEYAGRRARTPE